MIVRNFLQSEARLASSHHGEGLVRSVKLFSEVDFFSPLRFLYYMEMPPQTSIGYHQHGRDEEMYVILQGSGRMTVNGTVREVAAGDVILNKPGWSHGLENISEEHTLKLLVYEAKLCENQSATVTDLRQEGEKVE